LCARRWHPFPGAHPRRRGAVAATAGRAESRAMEPPSKRAMVMDMSQLEAGYPRQWQQRPGVFGQGPAQTDCGAEDVPCGDNCLESRFTGKHANHGQGWNYVGEGQGAYTIVPQVKYVGTGQGSFDEEPVEYCGGACSESTGKTVLFCVWGSLLCVLAVSGALLIKSKLPTGNTIASIHIADPYDCMSSPSTWEQAHAQWCCTNRRKGCKLVVQGSAGGDFDCMTDFSTWQTSWSQERKEWCCKHVDRGCTGGASRGPSFSAEECREAAPNDVANWPAPKKSFCCSNAGVGCGEGVPAQVTTTEFHDCQKDFSTWQTTWTDDKRDWCCHHEQVGCSLPTAAPVAAPPSQPATGPGSGCMTRCGLDGKAATCQEHIQDTADNAYRDRGSDACGAAFVSVFNRCPQCSACDLSSAQCHAPAASLATAPAQPSASLFDCNRGFRDYQHAWTIKKKAWCCIHAGKACPPKETLMKLPFANKNFKCDEGIENWETDWPSAKKAWCCITTKEWGCDQ